MQAEMTSPLADERVWIEKSRYHDAEKDYFERLSKTTVSNQCALVSEIAKARQHIKNSLEKMDGIAALAASPTGTDPDVLERISTLEKENKNLLQLIETLKKNCDDTHKRVHALESRLEILVLTSQQKKDSVKKEAPDTKADSENDDGVDLFATDSEDEDADVIRQQRLAEYNAKKSKKPALIAKSSVLLDVKPWDDETNLQEVENEIRKISTDGLLWGASKLASVAFGIKKLVISCVVEDDKVSIDWLTEEIEKIEKVQSVDVAAFNKI